VQSKYVSYCASSPNDCWLIRWDVGQIEVLSDDVLLENFDFFVVGDSDQDRYNIVLRDEDPKRTLEWWQPLVHVCRRWRGLVFRSPRRLNLQLYCTLRSVTRKTLQVWPTLPLIITDDDSFGSPVDNLISVLDSEHRNRICDINFRNITTLRFEKSLDSDASAIPGAGSSDTLFAAAAE
jgi:hypothetical protein